MTPTTFSEGSELAGGRYVLERRLGSGGMATVWLATDTRLTRKVAVKLPTEALSADATFARRFEREARTAAGVSHPNLVSVYDYGTEGERPYLVSEFINGATLSQLREQGRAPETEELARALLEALAHIHEAGIVHRDVKPANVLIDERGRILLTDFGIAQSTEETSLTATGKVVGTLSYIAPEVKRGERAGPAADLFACGVVLGEQLGERDPDRVARLVGALRQQDPAQRPASAERALEMLERTSVVVGETATMETDPEQVDPEPTPVEEATARQPVPRSRPQTSRAFPLPPDVSAPERRRSLRGPLTLGILGLLAVAVAAVILLGGGGGGGGAKGNGDGNSDQRGGSGTGGGAAAGSTTAPTTSTTSTETTDTTTPAEIPSGGNDPELGTQLNNEGYETCCRTATSPARCRSCSSRSPPSRPTAPT